MGTKTIKTKRKTITVSALRALRGSIRKWEGIVNGTKRDLGAVNCPLCRLYLYDHSGCDDECPVKQHTKRNNCADTPYDIWYFKSHGHGCTGNTPALKKAALAELKFLKSLLPKEKAK